MVKYANRGFCPSCQSHKPVFKLLRIPSEGGSTYTIINPSTETTIGSEDQKAVDAVYCDAYIDNNPIYLIVDTGSTSSIISKSFLDSIERTIDEPSSINMVDINGGKKRSLGKVKNLSINIKRVTIPIDVDVSKSKNYTVIVGNNWLTKTKDVIDFDHKVLTLQYQGRRLHCRITCWEKPKFDNNGNPTDVEDTLKGKEKEENFDNDSEFEDEEPCIEQQYCILTGDTNEKPLVEMDNKTITIGERKESIKYLKELEAINQPLITNKPLQQE